MEKLIVNSYDEFAAYLGKELGCSEWLQVNQDRINLFADATLDHQWIHVDVERAKKESQYQSTIAHGYLTLSLLPYMWEQIIEVNNIKMLVNYGMDKMRFGQPVITGSRVRLVTKLHNIQNLRGICKDSANRLSKALRRSFTTSNKKKMWQNAASKRLLPAYRDEVTRPL